MTKSVAGTDALGPRPELGPCVAYRAPKPEVYATEQGLSVWLLQRRSLPLVSLALVVRTGSADDPPGKAGLAHISTGMLDEGAGELDAVALSSAINDLGATLFAGASLDGSRVQLTVLRRHFERGFKILADVVARPRFDEAEWSRTTALWHNQLRQRADDPELVALVVTRAVLYGPDSPYGHPTTGRLDAAQSIALGEARQAYREAWRPDRALLVVAGDIGRPELDAAIARDLGSWRAPAEPAPARRPPPPQLGVRPKLVLVDRPDAPQAVIAVVKPGVAAADPAAPLLDLINTALGGSFTSRLNQNLREDHGWTYGARSAFVETRAVGPFVARAAVFTNAAGAALGETLREIDGMKQGGLSEDEYEKGRARDTAELIQTNETLEGLVDRLATLAALDLGPGFDAAASSARQAASRATLAALARQSLDTTEASIVVVGPKALVLPQLRVLGRGEPEQWDPDGRPLAAGAAGP
ncbi:MAG: insulinase family protein [Deltaproteobacteria bacterium]|nr:insulinase family protein [Deltaproteobacteria bacterium]